jgi:hypothetical protein
MYGFDEPFISKDRFYILSVK